MNEEQKDLGQNDASVTSYISNIVGNIASNVSHKLHPMVEQYAQLFAYGIRTPVLRRPDDYGMDYEDVTFPSMDGVPLEGWFIPAKDSDRLLIINHPMTCNKYGYPGHLAPWNVMFGGFEVNFLPELKALHEAGYNILTYDLRNCGQSGAANGGVSGLGLLECRDVVGSVRYAKQRPDTANMKTALWSRCMGGNSTIIAMSKWPEEFEHIRALGVIMVVSGRTFIEKGAELIKADPEKTAMQLDERLRELTGFRLDEETPRPYAKDVHLPFFMAQLRREFLIQAEKDGNEIFDAIGSEDKELFWIEDSNQRFFAYNYFGLHPEKLIAFFDKYMLN